MEDKFLALKKYQKFLHYFFIIISLMCNSLIIFSNEKAANMKIKEKEEEIPPTEDLMREHGVLNRILLIYEEIIKRAESSDEFPLDALNKAVKLIKDFIEDYHEHLEETYIFPLFEKNKKEISLVKTLRKQHDQGRLVTGKIQKLATPESIKIEKNKKEIILLLKKFIKMYRPHEAREDTVLFPQVRSLISEKEFKELGEMFEDTERKLFGEEGFDGIVKRVEAIEKSLGIYKLEQFTPDVENRS